MRRINPWKVVVVSFLCLLLVACGQKPTAAPGASEPPAKVEQVQGTQLKRVKLSQKAAQRLDIQMVQVSRGQASIPAGDTQRMMLARDAQARVSESMAIPYSAVLYDARGDTWTYISPEPLVFVRHHIKIDRVEGDQAVLSEGPPSGAMVVTVGAAELYGTELGLGGK